MVLMQNVQQDLYFEFRLPSFSWWIHWLKQKEKLRLKDASIYEFNNMVFGEQIIVIEHQLKIPNLLRI